MANSTQQRIDIRESVALIVLLINLSAVVWGAARISSSVDNLKEVTSDLKQTSTNQGNTITGIYSELLLLKLRIETIEKELNSVKIDSR